MRAGWIEFYFILDPRSICLHSLGSRSTIWWIKSLINHQMATVTKILINCQPLWLPELGLVSLAVNPKKVIWRASHCDAIVGWICGSPRLLESRSDRRRASLKRRLRVADHRIVPKVMNSQTLEHMSFHDEAKRRPHHENDIISGTMHESRFGDEDERLMHLVPGLEMKLEHQSFTSSSKTLHLKVTEDMRIHMKDDLFSRSMNSQYRRRHRNKEFESDSQRRSWRNRFLVFDSSPKAG